MNGRQKQQFNLLNGNLHIHQIFMFPILNLNYYLHSKQYFILYTYIYNLQGNAKVSLQPLEYGHQVSSFLIIYYQY